NSGGPMLDRQGRVHGLLTMKSMVSRNLGFATPVNALKLLLDRPNPVPIRRWLAQGAVSTKSWQPLFGAQWSQRAGRIEVTGAGAGFGGRALLLSRTAPPPRPYELTVTVRLEDESGAAGLAFASDGGDKHYGFYPTAGQLRLTRFEGPVASNWTILTTKPSEFYRPGEWNTLTVRVEPGRLLCYVNGHLVIESDDQGLAGGSVGLAKFRDTQASFKNFAVAEHLNNPAPIVPAELATRVAKLGQGAEGDTDAALLAELRANDDASRRLLREQASKLEREASRLRRLADRVHAEAIGAELDTVLNGPEEKIDLARAVLLLSKLDNPDLEIRAYQLTLTGMAREAMANVPAGADDSARVAAITKYLFAENGFHGSRLDYYNRANSYLDKVIDDHEGIPITLSVLFTELAARAGLTNVAGIPVPSHFMVKFTPAGEKEQYINVFEGGKTMTRAEIAELVADNAGVALQDEHLQAASKRQIVIRMLRNLFDAARRGDSAGDALRYLDVIVRLAPDSAYERFDRGMLRWQTGDRAGAKEDFKWLLDHEPAGIPLERVEELYRSL
ncbi:MAG TPA: tetratricopeptide repeat protein, partial [Verrucomicrobiae bacterium]|nr:tetratricopeptide repeat protein [Verrucomicrobiae bacterium]